MGPTYCNIILDNIFTLQLEVMYDLKFKDCFANNRMDYDKLEKYEHTYHKYDFKPKQIEEIKNILDNLEYNSIDDSFDFAIDYSNTIPIFSISKDSISNIRQYYELLTKYNKRYLGTVFNQNGIDIILKLQETIKEKFEVVDKLKIAKYLMEEYKKIYLLL